jgi:hypothetical protein
MQLIMLVLFTPSHFPDGNQAQFCVNPAMLKGSTTVPNAYF